MSHNTTKLNNPVKFDELTKQFATSGIYAIYCTHTDTYYIGQAGIVIKRIYDHFSALESKQHQNSILQREFDMFGLDSFVVDLLIDMPESSKLERLRQETREIQRFKLEHMRLYNKVHMTIKVNQPMPQSQHSSRPVNGATITTKTPRYEQKQTEPEEELSACEDCGAVGITYVLIFECDDRIMRCTTCIEKRLENWRIEFNELDQQVLDRKSRESYFRWLLNNRQHVNEQLANALSRFFEKHEQVPSVMYLKGFDTDSEFNGIKIRTRKITPDKCLDIPIV